MAVKPKPKPPIKESPVLFGRRKRAMSMAEYTRYWDSMKQAAEATGKGYKSRDPRIKGNTVNVATGGKVTSRTKLELYDLPKKKSEGLSKPKGTLPKKKEQGYSGLYQGTSPTNYSKPKGKRP